MTRSTIQLAALLLSICALSASTRAQPFVVPISPSAGANQPSPSITFDGFSWQGRLERRRVRAMLAASDTHLFITIQSQLPSDGTLLAAVDKDIEKLVFDDSIEVWIDPTPGSPAGASYQLLANSLGRRYFAMHARGGTPDDPLWNGNWPVSNTLADGWWTCRLAIPLSSIAPGRKATDGLWGINLCRNWKNGWAFSSLGGQTYAPEKQSQFRFTSTPAPVISHQQRRDPISGDIESVLTFTNPTAAALNLRTTQRLQRDRMPDVLVDEKLTLQPGQGKDLPLRLDDQGISKSMKLDLKVTSEDGQTTFYDRPLAWNVSPGQWTWRTARVIKPPIDLQFAYYPYLNKMRLLADISALPTTAKLDYLNISVRPKGKPNQPVKTVRLSSFDPTGRKEVQLSFPALEGDYEIAATAVGQAVPAGEVIKFFSRPRYEWEHNDLGKSRNAYAPFEPLRIKGQTVHASLRDHQINGMGLWDQVTATSANTNITKPILAAPMRYVVRIGGVEQRIEPAQTKVLQADDVGIMTENAFSAGPLHATARCTWDVDGMELVQLTHSLNGERPIDDLILEIPFADDAAPLMHAMAEGIRTPILSQPVPPGQGVVWNASKLPAGEFPKNFCTYIYVGSPVRGLCFFTENDKNWNWDPTTPNVELVRQGNVLTLRIHLINDLVFPKRMLPINYRTITFGLQAAPLKPRLAPWRYRYYRDRYTLLGTDINWLALGDCGSVYPAGKDTYFWEMINRGNKEHLSDAAVRATIERGRPYFEPYGKQKMDSYIAHVRHNLLSRYGSKMIFYYNRASYQAADEFQTFEDEWSLNDYRVVGPGKSIGEIKIVPSESYIDHALWWYGKSFDIGGNQGVYWDNWFIAPSQNIGMTSAYRRPDGAIIPATGILAMRELCKRTFQYMNERGITPITMPHMTSTNILPMHGFATVQYDWEWKYSEGDVQDRFTRPYILLVTNGDLAGTWPVLLGDSGKLGNDPWTQRTYAAVSIVHELDPCPRNRNVWKPLIDPIIAVLDDPKLQVYRYWDERPQPVTANHPDLPTIVYSVAGRQAVAAVTSYARTDVDATLTIDPAALGLTGRYTIVDVETGQPVPVQDNTLTFKLKKHDIREFRIEPAGN